MVVRYCAVQLQLWSLFHAIAPVACVGKRTIREGACCQSRSCPRPKARSLKNTEGIAVGRAAR